MEIVQQRLEQESDVDLVQTAPNVTYEVLTNDGRVLEIHKPQDVPDSGSIEELRQPIVRVNLIQPEQYVGSVMQLCQERRGLLRQQEYLSSTRVMLTCDLPLAEVIYDMHDKDMHDKLKSITRRYGTMDYELIGYFPEDLVRIDILFNGNRVDALSLICYRGDSVAWTFRRRRSWPCCSRVMSDRESDCSKKSDYEIRNTCCQKNQNTEDTEFRFFAFLSELCVPLCFKTIFVHPIWFVSMSSTQSHPRKVIHANSSTQTTLRTPASR